MARCRKVSFFCWSWFSWSIFFPRLLFRASFFLKDFCYNFFPLIALKMHVLIKCLLFMGCSKLNAFLKDWKIETSQMYTSFTCSFSIGSCSLDDENTNSVVSSPEQFMHYLRALGHWMSRSINVLTNGVLLFFVSFNFSVPLVQPSTQGSNLFHVAMIASKYQFCYNRIINCWVHVFLI